MDWHGLILNLCHVVDIKSLLFDNRAFVDPLLPKVLTRKGALIAIPRHELVLHHSPTLPEYLLAKFVSYYDLEGY